MTALVSEKGMSDRQIASLITDRWVTLWEQRKKLRSMDHEVQEYLHATSTKGTANQKDHEGQGHTTNIPMLYKTKEMLVALYMDMIFPSTSYMKWTGQAAVDKKTVSKGQATAEYMRKKMAYRPNAKAALQLITDFVERGRVASLTGFERVMRENKVGTKDVYYEGPTIKRLHPESYVFDVTATDVQSTPKIIRQVYPMAQIMRMHEDGSKIYTKEIMNKLTSRRRESQAGFSEDRAKYITMNMHGLGNYSAYLQSGNVEVLVFLGDLYDNVSNTLLRDQHILIVDRADVLYQETSTMITGDNFHYHVYEPFENTLGGLGPLHKVVGLQYALNHTQNMKANAVDLEVKPPTKFMGGDATQEIEPGARLIMDTDEDISFLNVQTQALQLNNDQSFTMGMYEQVTGIPSELSGIRTPGEKTATEHNSIISSGQRIPLTKAKYFEQFFWEPILQSMLEIAKENMQGTDFVAILNTETGQQDFMEVGRDDLAASGDIAPIGARGLAEESRALREFLEITQNPVMAQLLQPHISGKQLARKVEKSLNWEHSGVLRDFVQLTEQAELQDLATVADQKGQEHQLTPEDPEPVEEPLDNAPTT